jgi:hypothetical protein
MLHWWLLPAMGILGLVFWVFYLTIKYKGGSGVRTEGRTLVDKPTDEDEPPPA